MLQMADVFHFYKQIYLIMMAYILSNQIPKESNNFSHLCIIADSIKRYELFKAVSPIRLRKSSFSISFSILSCQHGRYFLWVLKAIFSFSDYIFRTTLACEGNNRQSE